MERASRRVTREMQAEFCRRRLAGESQEAIGLDYGLSGTTVGNHTKHLSVPRAGRPRTIDYGKAVEIAQQDSPHVAAERFGVGVHTIYRALRIERRGYP
jgi:hypothetical protein